VKPPASKRLRRRDGTPPAGDVHPHVLAVLQAVWRATATGPPPYYVSVASLGLGPDTDRNDAAVMLAVLSGWLKAGGTPPHSVSITWEGRALLKGRGLA
jgi:hypothetical protein